MKRSVYRPTPIHTIIVEIIPSTYINTFYLSCLPTLLFSLWRVLNELYFLPSVTIMSRIRFYCDVPDEFLFAPTVNLMEIAKAVKIGENNASMEYINALLFCCYHLQSLSCCTKCLYLALPCPALSCPTLHCIALPCPCTALLIG